MLDQLKRRGRKLANRCFLCEEDVETIVPVPRCFGSFFWRWLASIGFSPPV